LYSFTGGSDGGGVEDRVAFDRKGNLYGTTSGGGDFGYGTVFELTPRPHGPWAETVLHSFMLNDPDGSEPQANLLVDSAGNLYGTTLNGGAYNGGTAFELVPGSGGWTLNVLYSFCMLSGCADGFSPRAGFVKDESGSLYGTAGGAYELTQGSSNWTESVIYPFCLDLSCNSQDGVDPYGGVTFDAAGNLYGTTYYGGNLSCDNGNGCGVVYELTPGSDGTWAETVLYSFGSAANDGQHPEPEQLAFDRAGSLYGTTGNGGTNICFGTVGCGTIFKLTKGPNGQWKESILYDFVSGPSGSIPSGGLFIDASGSLYGEAGAGGSSTCGCGVVYKLTPGVGGSWTYSVLHTFQGTDGNGPTSGLISDGKGHLYGTTVTGGSGGAGVVFELTP
jgi:uncharacterized repeat protein (TIGR03803 family)